MDGRRDKDSGFNSKEIESFQDPGQVQNKNHGKPPKTRISVKRVYFRNQNLKKHTSQLSLPPADLNKSQNKELSRVRSYKVSLYNLKTSKKPVVEEKPQPVVIHKKSKSESSFDQIIIKKFACENIFLSKYSKLTKNEKIKKVRNLDENQYLIPPIPPSNETSSKENKSRATSNKKFKWTWTGLHGKIC